MTFLDDLVLRIVCTVTAAFGGWLAGAMWLGTLRVRDATVRSAVWTLAAIPPIAVALGLPSGSFFYVGALVPTGYGPFGHPLGSPALLVVWAGIATLLVIRRAAREARVVACVERLADAGGVPEVLADAVRRHARWIGVAAPRIAVGTGDGTAFVTGTRTPLLFVPLALWERLDAAGRRAMLCHELAHVRRRDPVRLRIVWTAADVLWPAFALRWTAARLVESWEAQADQEALHAGAGRAALARSLVEAAAGPVPHGVLAFGGPVKSVARRLRTLSKRPRAFGVALQSVVLVLCFPCIPQWGTPGRQDIRVEGTGDRDRGHYLRISFGSNNPFVKALMRDKVDRWMREEVERSRLRQVAAETAKETR